MKGTKRASFRDKYGGMLKKHKATEETYEKAYKELYAYYSFKMGRLILLEMRKKRDHVVIKQKYIESLNKGEVSDEGGIRQGIQAFLKRNGFDDDNIVDMLENMAYSDSCAKGLEEEEAALSKVITILEGKTQPDFWKDNGLVNVDADFAEIFARATVAKAALDRRAAIHAKFYEFYARAAEADDKARASIEALELKIEAATKRLAKQKEDLWGGEELYIGDFN